MCLDRIVPVYYNFTGEPREGEGSQIRNLLENIQMYFPKLQNVFVKMGENVYGGIVSVYYNLKGELREAEEGAKQEMLVENTFLSCNKIKLRPEVGWEF